MSAIVSLSRPGRCAGCVPLHLLISKLLRSGEHLAARALQSLPECRVRWTLYGTSLTVEVASCARNSPSLPLSSSLKKRFG